jgi:hypothetical protein
MGFGLPPVLQLARVPALRVIRRDVGALKPASLAVLGAGAIGFVTLLLAVSRDLKLWRHRGRRLCRCGRVLRPAVLDCGVGAAPRRCPRPVCRAGWCWRRVRSRRGRLSPCSRSRR